MKKSRNYPAIIYYQARGHFYIITDESRIRSVTDKFRVGTSFILLQDVKQKLKYNYVDVNNIFTGYSKYKQD
jgi:hypothetical protein